MQTVNSWSVPAITLNLTIIDELLWPLLKKLDGVAPFITDPTKANSSSFLYGPANPLPPFSRREFRSNTALFKCNIRGNNLQKCSFTVFNRFNDFRGITFTYLFKQLF